jgi:hypothetical protein
MRRFALSCVVVAAMAVLAPGSGVAAKVVFHAHESFSETFDDNICGIPGTSVVRGVSNFAAYADNTVKEEFKLTLVFTATESGKSIRIHVAQQFTSNDEPIDNGDGTVTFIQSFKGLPEQVKIANGPLLTRDAGIVTFFRIFDATTFEFISQTVSVERGPHPELDSDFELFCEVVVPALT